MKNLIAFTLLAVSFSGLAASKSDDVNMETLAAAKLKEMGVDTSAETAVKKTRPLGSGPAMAYGYIWGLI